MASLLLAVIYAAFISLGLPDSLLGSAWPVMHREFQVPLSYAGILTMLIAFCTIVSSLLSDRVNRRFGTGFVTAFSTALTAVALFGFSVSREFWLLCVLAVPYGLGAGAIDAALNNYVALHYASRHMSWLHCFWGIGTVISPYIMSGCFARHAPWSQGYRTVALIQLVLAAVLFAFLPLWRVHRRTDTEDGSAPTTQSLGLLSALRIRGVPAVLITFFGYCALEQSAGLWASSYLVEARGVSSTVAAAFGALFFIGITVGRFINGWIADRLGDRRQIQVGLCIVLSGILLVALPVRVLCLAGLLVIGIGCAPIYPAIIHATPENFGREYSQSIIGIQMASAYVGTTLMPPLFGWVQARIGMPWFPAYLLLFAVLMAVFSERLYRQTHGVKQ